LSIYIKLVIKEDISWVQLSLLINHRIYSQTGILL